MKYIVVILLLSTNGVDIEEIGFKHHNNCDGIANAWVDVNMKYYSERDGDPKLQGYYTKEGKLLLGWKCI